MELKDNKAPGDDNIARRTLKKVAEEICYPLCIVFIKNLSIQALFLKIGVWLTSHPCLRRDLKVVVATIGSEFDIMYQQTNGETVKG